MRRAAVLLAGVTFLASGCGSTHRGAVGNTTVRYGVYPGSTTPVSTTDPTSASCRQDSDAFARGSAKFLTHLDELAASPADPYYMLLRQQLADFEARRCDPELLGAAIENRLSPSKRQMLLAHTSRPMATSLRQALAAAGA